MPAAVRGPWAAIVEELDRWSAAEQTLRLWLRDDDAIEPTEQLDRLIDLSERFEAPMLLAVIPMPAKPSLVQRLARTPGVRPCQHGFSHHNHAPPGGKAEFGPHRAPEAMVEEIVLGWERLRELFDGRAHPIFVPPWNRIDPRLVPRLPWLGFRGLSSFRTVSIAPAEGLTTVNSDFDIIDWKGGRVGRPHDQLVAELNERLRARRESGEEQNPFGVLTHHLVHDETAWGFMDDFLIVMRRHPAVRIVDPLEVFGAAVS